MIGMINGKVCHLAAPVACVMTSTGIGYDIELPLPAFCQLQLDSVATLWTHLYVREDVQLLYGFVNGVDRDVFRQLIRINGVGAKMALAMMSTLSVAELHQCVEAENHQALVKVPGIGKKTAQRLLIELKGKLDAIVDLDLSLAIDGDGVSQVTTDNHTSESVVVAEVASALLSLGYRDKEATMAIKAAQRLMDTAEPVNTQPVNTQSLLKMTLQQLSSF